MEAERITPSEDTRLEALLREGLGRPRLPDAGFTERVLESLPRRRGAAVPYSLLLAMVWGASAAGLALALGLAVPSGWTAQAASRLGGFTAAMASNPWTVLASAVALASYLAALAVARAASRP